MNAIFSNYAQYYDLLYADKNYSEEVDYIHNLINKFSLGNPNSILDIGCGTGKHANLLTKKGFIVDGIDMSENMISIARSTNKKNPNLTFHIGNFANTQINKRFDVTTSLFHVFSYMTTNDVLKKTFNNVHRHLNKNGLFIFDFWYGPAVLTDKPTTRYKKFENDNMIIHRFASPVLHANENTVDVNYSILIEDKVENKTFNIQEKHTMRYFFLPELELLLENSGLKILSSSKWLNEENMDFDSWNGVIVAQN